MSVCKVIPVIESTIARKGKGVESDPIRVLVQYFDLDGKLLAERDEYAHEQERERDIRIGKSIELLKDAVANLGGMKKLQEVNPRLFGVIQGFKLD